jgi:hypothetical protein
MPVPPPITAPPLPAAVPRGDAASAGTVETAMAGEDPNPGERFPGRPDIRPKDRERDIGLQSGPARFSGWSAWIAAVGLESSAPDGHAGRWVKVTVRLVNRDDGAQALGDRRWVLLGTDGINRQTEFATPSFVSQTAVIGGGEAWGELWFPAPPDGRAWLSFRPDQASDRGVWAVDVAA